MSNNQEEPTLSLRGITVSFPALGGRRVIALSNINLDLRESEYVVVVGANGAGKSTLINIISGAVSPDAGEIRIDGVSVGHLAMARRAAMISRVFQDPTVGVCADLTLEENIALGMLRGQARSPFRRGVGPDRRQRAAELLAGWKRGLESSPRQPASSLSGGQRQLVALSVATARLPRILLLDEHTSALDPEVASLVMEFTDRAIREEGVTTLMVTHNLRQAARFGDRLLIMSGGHIVRDIGAEEKNALGESGLVDQFRTSILRAELTDRLVG